MLIRTALLVGLLCLAPLCTADQRCKEVQSNAPGISHMYLCQPSPIWELQHLWMPVTISLTCSSSEYEVHVASSESKVLAKVHSGADPLWCGLQSFWQPNECAIRPQPYQTTFIVVKHQDGLGRRICIQEESQSFSPALPVLGIVGILLFLFSDYLSTSTAFRLGSGTAIFTSLSLAILLLFLFRAVPHKKKVLAAMVAMGSTAVSVTRWAYGKWLPSLREVAQSPLFIGYVCCSAVVGLVLTYLFDNTANTKLNTLLKVGLRGLGLACLYTSTTSSPASIALLLAITSCRLWSWYRSWSRQRQDIAAGGHRTPGRTPHLLEPEASTYRTPLTAPPAPACSSTSLPDRNTITLRMRTPPPTPTDVEARLHRKHAPSPYTPLESSLYTGGPSTAGGRGPEDSGESADIRSPLVQQGLIVNGRTGKTIKLGGMTFNSLVSQGYTPDFVRGMLTPPEAGGSTAGLMSPRPSGGRGRRAR